ncbi:MAG: hypothetical protein VKJ27_01910 [Synechocystis sp.]|nr:hypothetical protein [Synechocystis sp.]
MNKNSPPFVTFNQSGIGCGLTLLAGALLLSAIGLKWVVNSIAILILLLVSAPVVGLFVFRWWLKRKLVESDCPVCHYDFTGFDGQECRCPNCGEVLLAADGQFRRPTPPGTIDVDAVDVSVKVLEES